MHKVYKLVIFNVKISLFYHFGKTYLRSTMTEVRYNNLMALHVNKERTDKLDLNLIAKLFIQKNERRIRFFGKL